MKHEEYVATDDTLLYINHFSKLEQISYNHSKVTDKGLEFTAEMPLGFVTANSTAITGPGLVSKKWFKQLYLLHAAYLSSCLF